MLAQCDRRHEQLGGGGRGSNGCWARRRRGQGRLDSLSCGRACITGAISTLRLWIPSRLHSSRLHSSRLLPLRLPPPSKLRLHPSRLPPSKLPCCLEEVVSMVLLRSKVTPWHVIPEPRAHRSFHILGSGKGLGQLGVGYLPTGGTRAERVLMS